LVYEDPAEAMNVSEKKWNEIVLKNKEDFENENQKKK
jgi:hypothetical protein